MTSKVPAGLKAADITRFATRAAQLEKFKPVVSYWCEYYIVNQIINKGLHTTDEECMQYTTTLMDKLEQTKAQYPDDDAILDDVAAKAYVEQFALDTFQRADNAVRANKASAQTADTFRAAATFLDLMAVWGPPDPELAAKSKFAKYHALRIAKALKAGEDPNLSNPVQEPEPIADESAPALDPNDPEVQRINAASSMQPTVETAPPSFAPSPTYEPKTSLPISPAGAPSAPPFTDDPTHGDVSPLESSEERKNSVGGGYFPTVPTFTSENSAPSLPTAPEQPMEDAPPAAPAPDDGQYNPQDFYQAPPTAPVATAPAPPIVPEHVIPSVPVVQPQPVAPIANTNLPPPTAGGAQDYRTDDESVFNAQKHAKWAISALNFEDVPTAVKELRIALEALGARFTPTVWSDLPKDAQNYFLNTASALTIEPEAYKRATYHTVQLADLPAAAQDLIQQKLLRQMSTAMFVLDGVLILTRDVMTALSEAELGYAGADPGLVADTSYALAERALAYRSLAVRSILGIAAEVATASTSAAAAAALQPIETGKRVRMVKMARVGTMVRVGKGKMLRRASRVGKVVKTVRVPRV
ncbi:Short-chain dehydrogenase/reductase SDR [Neofusicoccum parvum]|uniref:Short-chain dehydrogenase/reductase SDR n=1 Tax=Neofusicoccum parvum TaxID=310453 RepID=A0ACB5RPN6_9PEZI|nr:Short-chain dehydrogenase/reductase SDR [Neofusicoccum parvum]